MIDVVEWGYDGGNLGMEQDVAEFVERVKSDFWNLRIREGKKFMFRPPKTVVYEKNVFWGEEGSCKGGSGEKVVVEYKMQLLHELGHALLEHNFFATDLERIKMERAAWDQARALGERYGVEWDEEVVEEKLDTYRDWLHQRSKCKQCGMTGYQTKDGVYHCPFCEGGQER